MVQAAAACPYRPRDGDRRAALLPHLRADHHPLAALAQWRSDPGSAAFRSRPDAARHRGRARQLLPRRAHHVDRPHQPPRYRLARSFGAYLLRLRRGAAPHRGRVALQASDRAPARRRLGHDRDLARRHQRPDLYGGTSRHHRSAAADDRNGHRGHRRSA